MFINSTSNYPSDTINNLIVFATSGVDTTGVVFNVKNSKHPYAGRAYKGVPAISPFSRDPANKYLVVLRIGKNEWFPQDNIVTKTRWSPITEDEYYAANTNVSKTYTKDGRTIYKRAITVTHAYGGVHSPVIRVNDWKEALVALAAHEARHIHQFRYSLPLSEVDCEKFAYRALSRYREAMGITNSILQKINDAWGDN
jgi:hypothetical protein